MIPGVCRVILAGMRTKGVVALCIAVSLLASALVTIGVREIDAIRLRDRFDALYIELRKVEDRVRELERLLEEP